MAGRELEGKRAVVTGASSGIGRAIALAYAHAGARDLLVTWRANQVGVAAVMRELEGFGTRVSTAQLDLTEPDAHDRLADEVEERMGGADIWVNNAGADILTGEGAKRSLEEKLHYVVDVDLKGTVLASWAAVELMRRQPGGGVILNVAWDHVGQGMAGENPMVYAAAKGGILAFSKSLAREVAPRIRVNVLAPGFIETAFGERASSAWREHVETLTPLARWGTPEDVAHAAVYLASDAAAFLTGQTLMINGGVVM
ncbi:MAG TPA: SDR family oxidoreductase [Gemmatimonadales bacterium]|nr:SDR family oxidoreductase [Gemmatimonadales bacterium]